MTSTLVSRVSAAVLSIVGVILLFAPDVVLPRIVPGYPVEAAWLGQLLAAAWLGVAALNWLSLATVLGGIYGRPIVMANLALYFISALTLLRAAQRADFPIALLLLAVPAVALALAYGFLLFRGPARRNLGPERAAQPLTHPPALP